MTNSPAQPSPYTPEVIALAKALQCAHSTLVWRVTVRRTTINNAPDWTAEGDTSVAPTTFQGRGPTPQLALAALGDALVFKK